MEMAKKKICKIICVFDFIESKVEFWNLNQFSGHKDILLYFWCNYGELFFY